MSKGNDIGMIGNVDKCYARTRLFDCPIGLLNRLFCEIIKTTGGNLAPGQDIVRECFSRVPAKGFKTFH